MDANFMPTFRLLIIFTLLASCAVQEPKQAANPLESYLSRADGYASLTISLGQLGNDIGGGRGIDVDHADYIEKLRPAYDSARAFAPQDAELLSAHWTKFNQCMTLGSTTEDLAQACKYELGGIRAQITAR